MRTAKRIQQVTKIAPKIVIIGGGYAGISSALRLARNSDANVRQIFHRAQAQVRAQCPPFEVELETHAAVVNQFLMALKGGEMDRLLMIKGPLHKGT